MTAVSIKIMPQAWYIIIVLQLVFWPINITAQHVKVIYAVNAGGNEHTDMNGIRYEADPLHLKIGTASDYGNKLLVIQRVIEHDDILYRTERYHTATFGYDLPIYGEGSYVLVMKFCEVYFNEPNKKVFDVMLNKRHIIVSALDIFQRAGRGVAHEEYAFFNIKGSHLYYKEEVSDVRNGVVRVDFIKGLYDNPKINAFILLKGDVDYIRRMALKPDGVLHMDPDMAVFKDRISADSGRLPHQDTMPLEIDVDEDEDALRARKTMNPYDMESSLHLLPVYIVIGAFIPLLFCLCKL